MINADGFRSEVERAAQALSALGTANADDGLLCNAGVCLVGAQVIRVLWERLAAAERALADAEDATHDPDPAV